MTLEVVGCNHRTAPIALREVLAVNGAEAPQLLGRLGERFAGLEAVVLSTCNRTEFYLAGEEGALPSAGAMAEFLAAQRPLSAETLAAHLYCHREHEAVEHLFRVTASLDSMVLGEPQILAQVKQAYQAATDERRTGPTLHAAFQAALKAARRVAGETAIHQHRVSIPSVAVADFARQIFERFDDKATLVLGAGDMAEETLRYLKNEGARQIVVVNRSLERAVELAERWQGRALPWTDLPEALAEADLVVSTTGAAEPIVRLDDFLPIEARRRQRPLFVLDLAVPRDFEAAIGDRPGVYLYSIDDLEATCRQNRRQRDADLPAAERIIQQETSRFLAEQRHRATGPLIERLHAEWQRPKEEELKRLFNKLPGLDERARDEIHQSFDRLLNKLLHPPLESLRDESRHGIPHALLDALARLFQLKD